jgi:hypothetical protein
MLEGMPERLGEFETFYHRGVQDIWIQLIKSGKHPAIDIAEGYPFPRFELVPKDKDFGLQGSPRPEQPDDSAPDQSAEIAHSSDYQPIRR